MNKVIYAVSVGPGSSDLLTPRAINVLENSDVIVGYSKYLNLLPDTLKNKTLISGKMMEEIERCKKALNQTIQGKNVSVISSGDAGVYAMAGLLMELTEKDEYKNIIVEVVPGITAATAAASILGAPLMNDFAVISLSNLLTPEEEIIKRAECIASAGMVCVLYNPSSKKRTRLIQETIKIFKNSYKKNILCGIVKNASRENQTSSVCSIDKFPFDMIDMSTVVIIGNENTFYRNGKFYTLRGYNRKYEK